MSKTKYRIKGLPDPNGESAKISTVKDIKPGTEITDKSARTYVNLVAKVIGSVSLSDYLYEVDELNIQDHWPTFHFLRRLSRRRPIKIQPLALAPYLDCYLLEGNNLLENVSAFYEDQTNELGAIGTVLRSVSADNVPCIEAIKTPVAAAIASYCFRASDWSETHRSTLFNLIKTCPWASYLAFCSGLWKHERISLLHSIVEKPRLGIELFIHPGTNRLIKIECLAKLVEDHPHLQLAVAAAMQGPEETYEAFWRMFVDRADTNAMAAAFCLALLPENTNTVIWEELVQKNKSAIYWFLLTSKETNQSINPSLIAKFKGIMQSDPQWDYHVLRDIDSYNAINRVHHIWPNPWAMEIIQDLRLPFDCFEDLYLKSMAAKNVSKNFKDSMTLWGADHFKKMKDLATESSEHEDET